MMLKTTLDVLLNLWWQKRDLTQLLIRRGLFDHMNEIWQRRAIPCYQWFVAPWHVQGTPTQVNYVMAFQLGGLTNILRIWSDQGNPEPPEQIKDVMLLVARQLADSPNVN